MAQQHMLSPEERRAHNERVLSELEPGDLVEFPRGTYSHWAVYMGDDNVAHLAGDDNDGLNMSPHASHVFTISGVKFNKATVRLDSFWKVVENSRAKKNNSLPAGHDVQPLSRQTILDNVRSKMGETGYNLLFYNCEHFAKWCRYGISRSNQVYNIAKGLKEGGLNGALKALVKNAGLDIDKMSDKQ